MRLHLLASIALLASTSACSSSSTQSATDSGADTETADTTAADTAPNDSAADSSGESADTGDATSDATSDATDGGLAAACVASGGTVQSQLCCSGSGDFPNLCSVGACGCSPTSSHTIQACACGTGKCWNGTTCIAGP